MFLLHFFRKKGKKEPVSVGQPDQSGKKAVCIGNYSAIKAIKEATNTCRTGVERNWLVVGGPFECDVVREGQLGGVKVMKQPDEVNGNRKCNENTQYHDYSF